ncbi:D-alanine--D-alanine ligase [Streptobacillus felis]|uniref:D-alanine--D-alanine ligase n=1 Tax=Streptobacillus felis TaxID=1384509 RepID=A0A7Z0T853_9FUSO|nr:D-alanine--D-alanine ligase [Streptobacillus felis]NYV27559.1 D-alanine--D-alanine ligase [Streptobacillus felis]
MKIGVIYGGISTEREVSINTGKQIISNLDKNKYEVVEIEISKKEDIFKVVDLNLDFAYIALHGEFGESGDVQAVLETAGIKYSGSGILSSAVCMDKDITKVLVKNAGVRVIDGICVKKGDSINFSDLNLGEKVILKPNRGGSSIGIYFAINQEELEYGLEEIFKLGEEEVVIEEMKKGIEISVPIIAGKVFPTLLIEPLKDTFFDYVSKYENGGAKEYVHFFDDELQKEINDFTEKAYKAVKCKGFARIDYILVDNKAYFLEVNTLPGMTKNSLLPKSTQYMGYSYSETLDLLIEESMK